MGVHIHQHNRSIRIVRFCRLARRVEIPLQQATWKRGEIVLQPAVLAPFHRVQISPPYRSTGAKMGNGTVCVGHVRQAKGHITRSYVGRRREGEFSSAAGVNDGQATR